MNHGTYRTYVHDKCRCEHCTRAQREYHQRLRKQNALHYLDPTRPKTPTDLIDAGPARDHIQKLRDLGVGWKRIAEQAGVSNTTVEEIIYGRKTPPRPPRIRIQRVAAEKILSVPLTIDTLREGAWIPVTGTRRRIQALMTLGYPMHHMAGLLKVTPTTLSSLARHRPNVRVQTAKKVAVLYQQLGDQPATPHEGLTDSAIRRARNYARKHGYAPPAAWDNIDDPSEEPQGARTSEPRAAWQPEDIVDLLSQGESPERIATRFGVSPASIYSRLRLHGYEDLATRYGTGRKKAA